MENNEQPSKPEQLPLFILRGMVMIVPTIFKVAGSIVKAGLNIIPLNGDKPDGDNRNYPFEP